MPSYANSHSAAAIASSAGAGGYDLSGVPAAIGLTKRVGRLAGLPVTSGGKGKPVQRSDGHGLATSSDEYLVGRVAEGDAQAFRVLTDRHLDRTVTLARRVLGGAAEAEDVAQEAFLRLWQHAERFRPAEARFSTWFYRITMNLCLDRKRRPAHDALESVPEPVDPSLDAVALVERSELGRLVARAVDDLPERQRAAISLCYDAGLSNAEAAAAMEVSVGALETLLVRARRALRATLAPLAPSDAQDGRRSRTGGPR
ncbi:RNA polymerase sigma factor [Nitrospirillum sp. BR 11752]|uniref:RNA polymerase sigma-70 factor (ECF subfamily) n=1 Tax=Nitrospirillum amazonense TaxID=28077 RepID=A0A560H8A4_9PROT|nr:RNA polymerase sigma factor [Nitrospirillum amazonense]MEE3622959.1 RNA polymerase sigma factor [Nitrospirillum sp. BR 11752]TWB42572.1 RNA polymerase sigma-70 factor (ECF subfamily) [Nitrospirillum amazonense]